MGMSGNAFNMGGNSPFGSIGQGFATGLPGILQGLYGHSDRPYKKAGEALQPYYQQAQGYQNPFYQQGQQAGNQLQQYLSQMQDPSAFINHLMGQYQESPQAKLLQDKARQGGINAASASGLIGSTPFADYLQQNAADISSQDMQSYLDRVLGAHNQYGQGLAGLFQSGQHAGDLLSSLAQGQGTNMGNLAFGREAGRQQDQASLFGGLGQIFGGLFGGGGNQNQNQNQNEGPMHWHNISGIFG